MKQRLIKKSASKVFWQMFKNFTQQKKTKPRFSKSGLRFFFWSFSFTNMLFCGKMNLAIRGIDGSQVKWNTEGSFLNDMRKDLKRDGKYEDIKGFCKSANIEEITKHNFVLTPGRYVGIEDEIDDGIPFAEKIGGLTKKLAEQMAEEKKLDEEIKKQLKNVGFNL